MDFSEATYERYLAPRGEKITTLKNIKINEKNAQQMDFYKAVHPDGTERYYIGVVFRGHIDDYHGTKSWLEDRYVVSKQEGNEIYLNIKKNRKITNEEITTY